MIQEIRLKIIKTIESVRQSKLIIYVHNDPMSYKHIPIIYSELKEIGIVENLDIFIHSEGGDPDTAYKIIKMCREHCKGKLSIIVPLRAKGTATLLSIGTDEIVMGPSSELGPIDPQILDHATETWGATQHLRDSIDFFEERVLTSGDPKKTSYFLFPLIDKLNPFIIGKNERVEKSSKQYAKLLLKKGMLAKVSGFTVTEVVNKLSGSYYPHGYAIDSNEAKNELHLNVVSCNEYLWNDIWNLFSTYNQEMETSTRKITFIETANSIQSQLDTSNDYEILDENYIETDEEDNYEIVKEIEILKYDEIADEITNENNGDIDEEDEDE